MYNKIIKLLAAVGTTIMPFSAPAFAASKELIVLAAPASDDDYYAVVRNDIFNFHIAYAKQIMKHDDVLVLVDEDAYQRYAEALGEKYVSVAGMADIWARDYASANPNRPVLFRYTAAGQGGGKQGQAEADSVQKLFTSAIVKARLNLIKTDLLNDGGNSVDDGAGNLVVSTKFLKDNNLTEDQARKALRALRIADNIAFIEADEQGGLEHADGVVSFVDTNTLIVNSYPEDEAYAAKLEADLKRGLPGVKIHKIVTPYDGSKIYDHRFGSACGLYTNALVTPDRIYFPQFGIAEDAVALKQIKSATKRQVVPVMSAKVCEMGGGVRCMSWQMRGQNAERFKQFVQPKND